MKFFLFLLSVAGSLLPALAQSQPKLDFDGYGEIKIDMTFKALSKELNNKITGFRGAAIDQTESCFYVHPKKYKGIYVMLLDGKVARIDVQKNGLKTVDDFMIGDKENRLKSHYGKRLSFSDHHYGDIGDKYLTVTNKSKKLGIRYELIKGKVVTFYAGDAAAIEFVEGCA